MGAPIVVEGVVCGKVEECGTYKQCIYSSLRHYFNFAVTFWLIMLALFWYIKVDGRVGDTDYWVYCDTVQYPA